jgi:hypothetical protein
MPGVATAQSLFEQLQAEREALLRPRPPITAPIVPVIPSNGVTIYERDRPLPPAFGNNATYKTYKIIPLDRYGQPTQPLVTFDEVLTDMVWGSLHKKENK